MFLTDKLLCCLCDRLHCNAETSCPDDLWKFFKHIGQGHETWTDEWRIVYCNNLIHKEGVDSKEELRRYVTDCVKNFERGTCAGCYELSKLDPCHALWLSIHFACSKTPNIKDGCHECTERD